MPTLPVVDNEEKKGGEEIDETMTELDDSEMSHPLNLEDSLPDGQPHGEKQIQPIGVSQSQKEILQ